MSTNGNHNKDTIVRALNDVWMIDPGIRQFALTFDPARITLANGGWTVPVASGAAGGSGYELNRVLGRLQEEMEERTHLPVYIALSFKPI
ncbi:MAG: hypothetical protein ACKVW3_00650 [Phycisphaerales bacterium]